MGKKRGKKAGKGKTPVVTVRFTKALDVKERLIAYAAYHGASVNSVVIAAVEAYLELRCVDGPESIFDVPPEERAAWLAAKKENQHDAS